MQKAAGFAMGIVYPTTCKMEILNKNTFDTWWREVLSFLKYKFRNSHHADCEDLASEAFYLLIKDVQSEQQKLVFSVDSLKLLAYHKAIDDWRKQQRQLPSDYFDCTYPLSINGFFEQGADDFELIVSHISKLSPQYRLLLELKYKAIPLSQLSKMESADIHEFISKKYDDTTIAKTYRFKTPASVRTQRNRALNQLRKSVEKVRDLKKVKNKF